MRPNKYPIVDEVVMVTPTEITESGVYVTLLEYKLPGLILLRDLSKNRIRSMSKTVQVGKKFAAMVVSVDETAQSIILSKKCVTSEESIACEKNFRESKYVHDIAELFKRKMEKDHNIIIDMNEFYRNFIWCINENPALVVSALRSASKDFDKTYDSEIDEAWKTCFKEVLALKFKDSIVIVEAVLEITCEGQSGVDVIRNALLAGQAIASDVCPFKIKVIKPPYYAITIKTGTPQTAIEPITNAISVIKNILDANKATMQVIKHPEIVIDEEFKPEEESDSDDE